VFQFLIGTVKTQFCFLALWENHQVSIPHRYCKNHKNRPNIKTGPTVSIPHRYCKNPITASPTTCKAIVSIPHRYCKNLV